MTQDPRRPKSRLRRLVMGGFASLLAAVAFVVVPSTPAFAIQTISWTTSPPVTAVVGTGVSFAWSGTANTFLGARITGCYASFPDGNNYTNSFGGNFTTGNCQYANRVIPSPGTYTITVGFTLSTGSTMSQSWNVTGSAPTPTVSTPSSVTTTATSVHGAVATFAASASDSYYGSYEATCSPASGSVFPPGGTSVTCSATNPGGKTGSASFLVTVQKATPTLVWSPPAQVVAGRPLGAALDATMSASDATGTITYADGDGNALTSADSLPAHTGQVLRATYTPTGPASNAYTSVTAERTVDVVRIPQSVTFDTTPNSAFVDSDPFEVTASGTTDGGAVTIAATADSTCTVVDHSAGTSGAATVTATAAGTCVLEASQAQTPTYTAAPVAQHSVTIARRTPGVTWSPAGEITYGATLDDLLDASTSVPGTWVYRLDGVDVDGSSVPDAGDDRVLDVVFTPEDPARYTSTTESRVLDVLRAEQDLTAPAIDDRTYGDAPFEVSASSDGPGDLDVTTSGPCSIADRTVTPTAAGDCVLTIAQAGDSNHFPVELIRTVTIAKGTPDLTWGQPSDLTYGETVGDDQLDAVMDAEIDPSAAAPVGDLTYTLAGGALLDAGDHVVDVRWEPTGASADRWKPVTGSASIHVDRSLPTITWATPAAIVHGTPISDDQLNADVTTVGEVDGDVTYTLADGDPARGVVLGAGVQTLRATFDPSGPGAGNYRSASTDVTLDVLKAAQVIDFTDPGQHTWGDASFDLDATGGSSGQPVTFDADGACTVAGPVATITGPGTCSVTASQAGTDDFEAATPVVRTVTISGPGATDLAWSAPASIVYGTPLGADQLDATVTTDGATGTLTYVLADGVTPAEGAVLHAGDGQSIIALFEPDEASAFRFLPASVAVSIDVHQAPQVIDFEDLPDTTYGDPVVALQATGGASGQPVTYDAAGACDLAGSDLTLSHAGTCTVTAAQAGTADHLDAEQVTATFAIAKAPLVVTAPVRIRIYRAANPGLTPAYAGFVDGDDAADLADAALCTTDAVRTSPAGMYAVACPGAASPDYTVTTQPGSLRVRYGVRGFRRSITDASARPQGIRHGTTTPIRIGLTDNLNRNLATSLAAPIGQRCRATLRIDGAAGTTSCFRYDGTGRLRPFLAQLRSAGLRAHTHHTAVLQITASDGTIVSRQSITFEVS